MRTHLILAGLSATLLCACSSDSTQDSSGSGATSASATGGSAGFGGSDLSSSAGGVPIGGTDGNLNSGGGAPIGGASNLGGSGATDTTASGGVAPGSGGLASTGGVLGTGATSGLGGSDTNAGGSSASGGSPGGGGSTGVAGDNSGGAASGSGGSASVGGLSGTGATVGESGGSANAGGSAGEPNGAGTGGGTAAVGCTRNGLQAAVDSYLAALEANDTSLMPLASAATYRENMQNSELGQGVWATALPVSFHRSLLDVEECQSFTELFVTEGSHPYAIGTRLAIEDGAITEIESIVTDDGDWLFDAQAYAICSESEDWSLIPAASQSSREELIAAGQAYFDVFSDETTPVPWGSPCFRLEGGQGCTPAMAQMSQSCNVGIPDGITFRNTHWVVDVDLNAAVGITLFAGASPDTHMFRLIDGKIRYIHTLTVM